MVLFCIVTVRLLEDFDSALITGVYSTTPSGSISKQVFTLTRIYSTQQVACNHTFFSQQIRFLIDNEKCAPFCIRTQNDDLLMNAELISVGWHHQKIWAVLISCNYFRLFLALHFI